MTLFQNPYKISRLQAEEIKTLQYEIGSLNTENKKLRFEIEQCKDKRIVEKLLELNRKNLQSEVLAYKAEVTKCNEKVVCYLNRSSASLYSIYVLGFDKRNQMVTQTTLMFAYNSSKDHRSIYIQDIQNKSNMCKGLGTVAMNMLLEFASNTAVKEISGRLLSRDLGNDEERNRRVHFYQTKFGFRLSG